MSRSLTLLLGLTALLPVAVEAPPDSTRHGETRLQVAGGYGYYAIITRGCQGEILSKIPIHSLDGAIGVDHRFARVPERVGVRGGWTRDRVGDAGSLGTLRNSYVNPFVDAEGPSGSFSLGWVAHRHDFPTTGEQARVQVHHPFNDLSFHLIAGSERRYFAIRWMEGMPIYSDGGYLNVGAGEQPAGSRFSGFLGMAAGGPMEGAGPMLRLGFDVTPRLRLGLTGQTNLTRAGNVGLALEYRFGR
jgi:hypothetical protein